MLMDDTDVEVMCPEGRHTTAETLQILLSRELVRCSPTSSSSSPSLLVVWFASWHGCTPTALCSCPLTTKLTSSCSGCPPKYILQKLSEDGDGLFAIWVVSGSLRTCLLPSPSRPWPPPYLRVAYFSLRHRTIAQPSYSQNQLA